MTNNQITYAGFSVLLLFFALVAWLPRGRWKTRERLSTNPNEKDQIRDMVSSAKEREIEQIAATIKQTSANAAPPDNSAKVFSDKLSRAIDYAIKRHDWYEDQRSRVFQIIVAICSIMLTVIGFTIKAANGQTAATFLPIILNTVSSLIIAIYYYNIELDADRPYRLVSDIRFWFFRYNLPQAGTFVERQDRESAKAERVLLERKEFFSRLTSDFSATKSLREDTEQLFILQLLQRSKSESLQKLRWLMSYTIIVLVIQLFMYLSYELPSTK